MKSLTILFVLVSIVAAGKVQVAPMNLGANLRVAPTKQDWENTEKEIKELLAHAKSKKYSTNILLMMQGIASKVEQTGKQMLVAIQEKEAVKAKNKVLSESSFTSPDVAVKPLKKFSAAKRDLNVPRYTASQVKEKIAKKKLDFSRPFLISNGVTELEKMQKKFTAKNLMQPDYKHVEVRYITPVEAKKKRKFEESNGMPGKEEQLQAHMISFEKFFVNCFNLRARKDFKKAPGANTEHCENAMEAAILDKNYSFAVFDDLPWMNDIHNAKKEWVSNNRDELQELLPSQLTPESLAGGDTRLFTFGPSGSGNELKSENHAIVDGLLHGRRRWLFMKQEHFNKLREKAGHDMEPASAFVFFESQLAELQEDYDLGRKKLPYMECNQEIGDLLYIPRGMVRTALSLQDSASFAQKVVPSESELAELVSREIWDPASAQIPTGFRAMSCFGFDLNKLGKVGLSLGGVLAQPQQAQMITQVMAQNFAAPQAVNMLALQIVMHCTALSTKYKTLYAKTFCEKVFGACSDTVKENALRLGKAIPTFLATKDKSEL